MGKELVSIIVPVTERFDNVTELFQEYKNGLLNIENPTEFIYVLDGDFPEVFSELVKLQETGETIKIVKLAKWFGESIALTAGVEVAAGELILTLPAYYQVKAEHLGKMFESLEGNDMVICRRWPRSDSLFSRVQTRVFHRILKFIDGYLFRDLGCGVRLFKKVVMDEISVYGDQHRFLPILALRQGFKVLEINIPQSEKEKGTRIYGAGVYLRRLIDILSIFFLVKFTKKPLRFFGLIGSATFILGGALLLFLAIERLFYGVPLGDRPLLLLGALLFVLGIQVFATGLIGELIIFTHAKELKEYTIEEIV
ncbi:MAG: glycosyltransferase [Gammaproteobacteria bacterium]|nr:glycosyltransferase [Gammaproteobacteria bacterium]